MLTLNDPRAPAKQCQWNTDKERWLSWSKAHDWKSCVPLKGTEGSNPSLSAKNTGAIRLLYFFDDKRGSNIGAKVIPCIDITIAS